MQQGLEANTEVIGQPIAVNRRNEVRQDDLRITFFYVFQPSRGFPISLLREQTR